MKSLTYKDFKFFKKFDFFILIPSKGRAKTCGGTLSLFPQQSCLYVHESEAEEYRKYNPDAVIVTHKRVKGYGSVVNSAITLSNKSGCTYMFVVDDDMDYMASLVGNSPRYYGLSKRYELLVNAVQVMNDIDVYMYLFSTSSSIIKYMQNKPYSVGFSLPQGAYILNTPRIGVTFDERYSYYEDFDFCMAYIMKHRFVIIEQRTILSGYNIDSLTDGGCNSHRTAKSEELARKWVRDKWKSHIRWSRNSSGNIRPSCNVDRVAQR